MIVVHTLSGFVVGLHTLVLVLLNTVNNVFILRVAGIRCDGTAGLHRNIQRPKTWPQISIHRLLAHRQSGADTSAQNCATKYTF